jgi:hypothetical protein
MDYDQGIRVLRAIVKSIGDEVKMDFSNPQPTKSDFDLLIAEIIRRFHFNGNPFGDSDHNWRVIYRGKPHNFNKGNRSIQGMFAHLLFFLREFKLTGNQELKADFDNEEYSNSWERYLREYFTNRNIVEHVNLDFWMRQVDLDHEVACAQFIEKNRTDLAPYLIENSFIKSTFPSEKELKGLYKKRTIHTSLKEIIFDNALEKRLIQLSSKNQGEGKTTFLWEVLREQFEKINCLFVNDLHAGLIDLPLANLNPRNDILIVLDSQLKYLDTEINLLNDFCKLLQIKYSGKNWKLLLVDSDFHFTRYFEQVDDLAVFFGEPVIIEDFRLDFEENNLILNTIVERYDIDRKKKIFEINDFQNSRFQAPLIFRIWNLLGCNPSYKPNWSLWTSDEQVKSLGLKNLYFLSALLNYYDIKLPLDFTSFGFLKNEEPDEIIDLFKSNPEYEKLLKLKSKYSENHIHVEYPENYIKPTNTLASEIFILYDKSVFVKANNFLSELIQTIESGEACNCHAYVFRKLCVSQTILAKLSPFKSQFVTKDAHGLLEKLTLCKYVDEQNRIKCITVRAQMYVKDRKYEKAQSVLNEIANKDQVVMGFQARVFYYQKLYDDCLEILSKTATDPTTSKLRFNCYVDSNNVYKGIEYYFNELEKNGTRFYELPYLLDCIDWLSSKGYFEDAKNFLEKLEPIFRNEKFTYYHILHSKCTLYHDWYRASKWDESEITSDQVGKLDEAMKLLSVVKSGNPQNFYNYAITEAHILSIKGDVDAAIQLIETLHAENHESITQNYIYAYCLLKRNGSGDRDVAWTAINRNFEVFKFKGISLQAKIPTILIASDYYFDIADYKNAKQVIQNFIKHEKINYNKNNPTTRQLWKAKFKIDRKWEESKSDKSNINTDKENLS